MVTYEPDQPIYVVVNKTTGKVHTGFHSSVLPKLYFKSNAVGVAKKLNEQAQSLQDRDINMHPNVHPDWHVVEAVLSYNG